MKKIKCMILILLSLVLLALSIGWFTLFYYPQKKLEAIKVQYTPPIEKTVHLDTYLDTLNDSPKPSLTYVVIGDSVAKGVKATHESFGDSVSRSLSTSTKKEIDYINLGVSKQTSSELVHTIYNGRVIDDIKKADIISLNIGGNDLVESAIDKGKLDALKDYPNIKNEYMTNVETILGLIYRLNPNCIVVMNELYNVINPSESFYPATKKMLLDWNLVAYESAQEYENVLVAPISDVLNQDEPTSWLADEVHPNNYGHKLMAETIFQSLKLPLRKGNRDNSVQ